MIEDQKGINRKWTLYVLIFPDKKAYVGITSQKLEDRWGSGRAYKLQPVGKAIEKFGWDNIKKIVVAEGLDKNTARSMEEEYISKYENEYGVYNKTSGGECGYILTAEFKVGDKTYTSKEIAEMSDVDGISYHDITTRVNHHGWTLEEAISKEKAKKNIQYEYNGSLYTSNELYDIRKNKDLSLDVIRGRLSNGWDIDRAISQPDTVKKQPCGVGEKEYYYNGKYYNSYELFLMRKDERITQHDIVNRIKHSHWDIEKAISAPPKNMNRRYLYKGKYYSSKELEKISPVGLLYNTIVSRIKLGWSVEDAVETPALKKN